MCTVYNVLLSLDIYIIEVLPNYLNYVQSYLHMP